MSSFDSLLNTVWQVVRSEEDLLTTFARLQGDRQRAEKILALPQLQDFCVTDDFSGKCETRAEALRLLGDRCYLETTASTSESADVKTALELYNSAIKLAPHGSRSLAHSYYGRSQVLLHLGYTSLALEDAERALRLKLPQQDAIKLLVLTAVFHQQTHAWIQAEESLREALDKLRNSELENNIKATMAGEIICQLKTINESKKKDKSKSKQRKKVGTKSPEARPRVSEVPDLTYGKNANMPAASAALRLCQSPEKGRYMEATRDIKMGSVLIVEEPYAWSLSREAMVEHCLHCCRLVQAPVPCTQCATVSYCCEECRDNSWHDYHRFECRVLNHLLSAKELSKMALLVYRTTVTAYSRAGSTMPEDNVASGKDTKVTKHYSAQLLDSSSTEQESCTLLNSANTSQRFPFLSNDYASVFGQVTNSSSRTPADLLKRTTSAYFLMRCFSHLAPNMVNEVEMTTTLLRHLQSCSCNAYQITEQILTDGNVRSAEEIELGGAVYPTISLCNHSCNPNVVRHSNGKTCIVRAIRPIKKGEEILDNYGPHFLSNNLDERYKDLHTQYFFKCNCKACSEKWPTVDKLQFQVTQYKCIHCSVNIGSNLSKLKICFNCKKKCDYGKIAKRLQILSGEYNKALEDLLQGRLHECLKTCIDYCDVMDRVVIHPNKQFVNCQQAVTLCWSLLGNTSTQK